MAALPVGLSWEAAFALALVAGAGFALSVSAAALAWFVISAVVKRTIGRWSRSPIQGAEPDGEAQRLTSDISALVSAVTSLAEATGDRSAFSGLSNGSEGESPTSTPSALTNSRETSLPAPGMKSLDPASAHIWWPALASKNSDPVDAEPSNTPKSTLRSNLKKNCRICSKIRALVGGGVS